MRGVYTIAALSELDRMGHTDRFSVVSGASSGAMNGAYFLAGQADAGESIYVDHLPPSPFINRQRLHRVADIDYLVDTILADRVALDLHQLTTSPSALDIALTDAEHGTRHDIRVGATPDHTLELLRATAALPILYGREIPVGAHTYVDGGVAAPLPIPDVAARAPLDGLLLILTRPRSHTAADEHPAARVALRALAHAWGHSPGVARALGQPSTAEHAQVRRGDTRAVAARTNLPVWTIAPSDPRRLNTRLCTDRTSLADCAAMARDDVRAATA